MRKGLAILAVAVLLVIVAFALLRDAPKPVQFTLANGRVFEVMKVTTGPNHRFRYDNRWQDFAGQFLPGKLRAKLKPHILEYTTTNSDALVLWVRSEIGIPFFALAIGAFPKSEPAITVADEHGVEVGPLFDRLPPPGAFLPGSSSDMIFGRLIAPLPRHAREITLGFYERGKRLGELKLPNPAYHGESSLRPETLPQVKSAGDVQVKLWNVDSSKQPANDRHVDWTINAALTRNGQALPDWRLDTVEVFDEVKQLPASEMSSSIYDPESQRAIYHYFDAYWPDTAWKLRLWVVQVTNFSTAETWTLSDVPVPGPTETIARNELRQLGDSKVEWLGVSRPQGKRQTIPGRLITQFRVPKTDDLRIVFIRGHDDLGRKLSRANGPQIETTDAMPGVITYSFGLVPWYNARTITLEFAVHRARSVDFIVKPSRSTQSRTAPSPKTP